MQATPLLVETLFKLGYELPNAECKEAFNLEDNKWMLGQTLRAMAGMANFEGGGVVLIGISEREDTSGKKTLVPTPFSTADLNSWDQDKLQEKAYPYFDPPIAFSVSVITLDSRSYIAIEIEEFDLAPVLSKKQFQATSVHSNGTRAIINEGVCYVRNKGRRSTEPIPNSGEMRNILDRAIHRGMSRELEKLRALGLVAPLSQANVSNSKGDSKYNDEAKDIL